MNLTGRAVYQKGSSHKRQRENDNDFLAWIRTLPSAISGKRPCIAAHYRTAFNSGVGIKPLYSAIPLTDEEHKYQHHVGQYDFMSRDRWESLTEHYRLLWGQIKK